MDYYPSINKNRVLDHENMLYCRQANTALVSRSQLQYYKAH